MNNKLIQTIGEIYNLSCLRLVPLRESSDNKVFIIKTDKDISYVLRVSKRDIVKDILFELKWIEALRKKGFPVADVIKTKDGQLFFCCEGLTGVVFRFIDGYHIKINKHSKPDLAHVKKTAELLADLHSVSADIDLDYSRERTIFSELKRVLSKQNEFCNLMEGGEKFVEEVKKNVEWAERNDNSKHHFIINDFRPGNVIFKDEKIVALIDFDWSCIGPTVKDLALGIAEWSFPDGAKKPWNDVFSLFLDSYNKESKTHYVKDDYLYKWICFACLSDTATYLCDMADTGTYRKVYSSYMYQKYLYFQTKINF